MKSLHNLYPKVSILLLFFFIVTQVLMGTSAFAQGTMSGKILKITPLTGDQFELIIQTDEGDLKFIVDSSTLVQSEVAAEKVKIGNHIFVPSKAKPGKKGSEGIESPFKNIPPALQKEMGLPNIPDVPGTPKIPSVPEVPQAPKPPEIPKAPQASPLAGVPQAPKIPQIPQVPQAPAISGPGAPAPAAGGEETAPSEDVAAPTAPAPDAEAQKRAPEEEISEPPLEARSSVMKKPALSPPTPALPKIQGKRVIQLEETDQGVTMQLETATGEKEEQILAVGEKVIAVLTIQDLKKNMSVQLEVAPNGEEKFVQKVTVL